MKILTTIQAVRDATSKERQVGHSISFVPTLGNLHEGHISLVRQGIKTTDCVIVSIFVNPMQFAQDEDLDAYPRTIEQDQQKLLAEGVKYIFFPTVSEMYPHGITTKVTTPGLSQILCGTSRPDHFAGVTTICSKLFNIIQPDIAIFGEKDYQQLTIIRHMVNGLCMPIQIIGMPTERAQDGLALSSRNQYLSAAERAAAPTLYAALKEAKHKLLNGEKNYSEIEQTAIKTIALAGFNNDYFHIVRRNDLEPPTSSDTKLIIVAAAQLGSARLIDNIQLDL